MTSAADRLSTNLRPVASASDSFTDIIDLGVVAAINGPHNGCCAHLSNSPIEQDAFLDSLVDTLGISGAIPHHERRSRYAAQRSGSATKFPPNMMATTCAPRLPRTAR